MQKTNQQPEKIGAVCFQAADGERKLTLEEILLDETLVQGSLWAAPQAISEAGGVNDLLEDKKGYELLLRIAEKFCVVRADERKKSEFLANRADWRQLSFEDHPKPGDSQRKPWKTDCYVLSRYKKQLLDMQCFDEAVLGIVSEGGQEAASYLETMLAGSQEYFRIYDYTQPILIYVGDATCYQVLDMFARSLGKALQEHGCRVIYFDMEKQPMDDLLHYIGKRFKAVVGMQTYLFSVKQTDGRLIHDVFGAAEYHFVFDHPVWLRHHLMQVPKQMTVLTPDGNYAAFIEKYYGHKARFLPPAGQETYYGKKHRLYDLAFLGTYGDSLLDELKELRKNDRKKAHFVSRYLLYMRQDIAGTPEHALEKLLAYYRIAYTDQEFEEKFCSLRWSMLRLSHYYRRKVVEALLQAGLTVHVFGESWKNCPLRKYPGLICHPQAVGEDAFRVYGNAKLSLNIMTWHKDGFTERIANAMLQKSVVITDRTAYLDRHFQDGEELILFRLGHLQELPQRIKDLLEDEPLRAKIAENGYQKAKAGHTWYKRAEELLLLMQGQEGD